jgi:hypothetical protein
LVTSPQGRRLGHRSNPTRRQRIAPDGCFRHRSQCTPTPGVCAPGPCLRRSHADRSHRR